MLYTCDLICWGAASPAAFHSFLSMLERRSGRRVTSYAHRGAGMRPHGSEIATYADGSAGSGTTATSAWRRIWYDRLCRESCYRCGHHSTERPGDITIGDWWGLRHFMPELEDPWGVSCAVASAPRGLALLRDSSDALEPAATPVADVANPAQPMLEHPPERKGRDAFWPELCADGFEAACRSVGALGPERAAKELVKRAAAAFRGGPTKDSDASSSVGNAWEEVPKVDFDGLESRGEYPVAFAVRNRDDGVRRRSSSGGVYHALASHVIEDLGGVVYGCAFDGDLRAVHIRCETMAEAERCMGSKYSQSDMGDTVGRVREDLGSGRAVLFTGTPCQVAAVRAACATPPRGVLMTADIICHGVPSPGVFQGWLAELERARGARVIRYEHRPKSMGWGHFERVTWEGGHAEQGTRLSEAWKRLFYGNRMLRPSCCRCPYTVAEGHPGDLTIADFWGVGATPHARGDDGALGVSLVLANGPAGLRALSELDVDCELATMGEALPGNPMLERPSAFEGDRDEPWRELYGGGLLAMAKGECYLVSPARALASRAKRAVKRILGR